MATDDEVELTIKIRKSDLKIMRQICVLRVTKAAMQVMAEYAGEKEDQIAMEELDLLGEPLERIRNAITNNAAEQRIATP